MTPNTGRAQTLKPFAVAEADGEARWGYGILAVIKATASNTGGQMSIIEITEPPGGQAPLHVHHREDEGFWILEGDVTFQVGDTTIEAHAGDYAFGPRDVPHGYTVGDRGCRMLFIFTPGGIEGFFVEVSEPAANHTLPPPSGEPPDLERMVATARKYGVEFLE